MPDSTLGQSGARTVARFKCPSCRELRVDMSCWRCGASCIPKQRADDCPGCGAPDGFPPAGPCDNHGTAEEAARGESLRCPVCGYEDVGVTGTCRRGHKEVEMDDLGQTDRSAYGSPGKDAVIRRWQKIEEAAREACEAEFTSERLAAMQRLREVLDA